MNEPAFVRTQAVLAGVGAAYAGVGAGTAYASGSAGTAYADVHTADTQAGTGTAYGSAGDACACAQLSDPDIDTLKRRMDAIFAADDKPLLQFSGGEPTLRDDLPELVAYARSRGCRYTQLNSNGIRLAEDEAYVRSLAQAGLSFVFLQFDGVDDDVYIALRGVPLYQTKLQAIRMCDKYNIGVSLVPTIVRGVNEGQIGAIIRQGTSLSPSVRGVHFQPVGYLGRYPGLPGSEDRFTLDELLCSIQEQAGISLNHLLPSRCDHPLCGFHGSFLVNQNALVPLSYADAVESSGVSTAKQNREYIGRRWEREAAPEQEQACCCSADEAEAASESESCCCTDSIDSLDGFLQGVKKYGFTISGMVFQDAMNLDVERLRRCSLHVYHEDALIPFCARYLTPMEI